MRRILITGANRGIGLELARQACERGDAVTAVCRSAGEELNALDARVIEGVDVCDADTIAMLADAVQGETFDILVNNAGILERDSLEDFDLDSVRRQFEVNAVGPLNLTRALLANLARGSRVFVITSRMGSIEDNTSGGYYGYRMSKAAVNMAARSLSVDLADHGIGVYVLHPGYVATDMTGHQGQTSAADSAAGLWQRMMELEFDATGSFWHAEGYALPW